MINVEEVVQIHNSLVELIEHIPSLPGKDWIYANLDSWRSSPEETKFFYIPWNYIQDLTDDEIYLDEEDMEMPKSVEKYNLRCWVLVSQLGHILKNKVDGGESVKWVVDEINFYRESDVFRT